jgi:hypothetical protein
VIPKERSISKMRKKNLQNWKKNTVIDNERTNHITVITEALREE